MTERTLFNKRIARSGLSKLGMVGYFIESTNMKRFDSVSESGLVVRFNINDEDRNFYPRLTSVDQVYLCFKPRTAGNSSSR